MTDPTEDIRRKLVPEINAEPGSREASKPSTAKSGDTQQLQEDFEVRGFGAPLVVVRCAPHFVTRLSSGEQGRATTRTIVEASDVPLVPLNVNVRELPR